MGFMGGLVGGLNECKQKRRSDMCSTNSSHKRRTRSTLGVNVVDVAGLGVSTVERFDREGSCLAVWCEWLILGVWRQQ